MFRRPSTRVCLLAVLFVGEFFRELYLLEGARDLFGSICGSSLTVGTHLPVSVTTLAPRNFSAAGTQRHNFSLVFCQVLKVLYTLNKGLFACSFGCR